MNKRRISQKEQALLKQIGATHARLLVAEDNELLQKQSDTKAPASLDVWFDNNIGKNSTGQKPRVHFSMASKALVSVCLVIAIISITVFSVDAWRIRFFNMVIENKKIFTEVSVSEKPETIYEAIPGEWTNFYYPNILPEGYILRETHTLKDSKIIIFANENEQTIQFITADFGYQFQIDTEDAVSNEVTVNGDNGMIIKKGDRTTVIWSNYDTTFILLCDEKNVNLLQIAEKIEKVIR